MYEMIAQLQAKGFSNDVINLFENNDASVARKIFDKLMIMTDEQIRQLNYTERKIRDAFEILGEADQESTGESYRG